jgi:hypothetical protein
MPKHHNKYKGENQGENRCGLKGVFVLAKMGN